MTVDPFTFEEFLVPLDPLVIAMALVLGVVLGLAIHHADAGLDRAHLYWTFAAGLVFYVPLALLRGWQGSGVWERFLASGVLWAIFVVGMYTGGRRR